MLSPQPAVPTDFNNLANPAEFESPASTPLSGHFRAGSRSQRRSTDLRTLDYADHLSLVRMTAGWIPAFAGMTVILGRVACL